VITAASNAKELDTPICCKCLGFLLHYTYSGKLLFLGIKMLDIIKSVGTPLVSQNTSTPTAAAASTLAASGHSIERKPVPAWTISLARMRTIFLGVRSP